MQLSLEKFPPLISHIVCVFIGVIIAYLANNKNYEQQCYLPNKVYLSDPKISSSGNKRLLPGYKVFFVKEEAGNFCLLSPVQATVAQNDPFLVFFIQHKHADIISILTNKNHKGKIRVVGEKNLSSSVPKCRERQILYGNAH